MPIPNHTALSAYLTENARGLRYFGQRRISVFQAGKCLSQCLNVAFAILDVIAVAAAVLLYGRLNASMWPSLFWTVAL